MAYPAEPEASYHDLLWVPTYLVAEIVNGRLITRGRRRSI